MTQTPISVSPAVHSHWNLCSALSTFQLVLLLHFLKTPPRMCSSGPAKDLNRVYTQNLRLSTLWVCSCQEFPHYFPISLPVLNSTLSPQIKRTVDFYWVTDAPMLNGLGITFRVKVKCMDLTSMAPFYQDWIPSYLWLLLVILQCLKIEAFRETVIRGDRIRGYNFYLQKD